MISSSLHSVRICIMFKPLSYRKSKLNKPLLRRSTPLSIISFKLMMSMIKSELIPHLQVPAQIFQGVIWASWIWGLTANLRRSWRSSIPFFLRLVAFVLELVSVDFQRGHVKILLRQRVRQRILRLRFDFLSGIALQRVFSPTILTKHEDLYLLFNWLKLSGFVWLLCIKYTSLEIKNK